MKQPNRPHWLKTWTHLYAHLEEDERRMVLDLLRQRLEKRIRQRSGWRLWLRMLREGLSRVRPTPAPLRLPLVHAGLSFAILAGLPRHPMAMPTALGLALAIVVYAEMLARRGSAARAGGSCGNSGE